MRVEMYMQISKDNPDYNKKCLIGIDHSSLYASTSQPFNTEGLDTIKLLVDIPDKYFKVNCIAEVPVKVEIVHEN